MRQTRITYLAQTQPGFEAIVAEQLRATLEGVTIRELRTISDKNGIVIFDYPGNPQDLLDIRSLEDVFALLLNEKDFPPTYRALGELRDRVQRMPLEAAVALARQFKPGRGGQGKLRFRIVARQIGEAHFRRVDAQEYVAKGLMARTERRWLPAEQNALEFWLTLTPGNILLALRLSDETMRHRSEKRAHLPASLRPAAAAALVYLTRPRPDDTFLDPMCGAGTILIERAQAGRYRQLLGGDIREEALEVARANIGTRYQPITLQQWDARNLPFDAASISACAVNLPFGLQLGSLDENRTLYPAVLRELTRLLRPNARLAALTGDTRAFEHALKRFEDLILRDSFPVMILGRRATAYQLQRR